MSAHSCGQRGAASTRNKLMAAKWAASLSCVSIAALAQAQSNEARNQSLEEIIVTAQKQSERMQDVPMAMSAINAETLVKSHQLRLEDYYQKLPGVSLTQAGNGSEPMIIMRGMVTTLGGNPTTGVVIDEVSYGRSVSLSFTNTVPDIDPGDIARVEVLRGPQGTLYGASSIGGLLKYVTVDPSMERVHGRIEVGSTHVRYGDDLGHSVRGAINVPLADTMAVRLSGFTVRDPGYIDNAETGERDLNARESDGGRLAALWRPSEDFSLRLSALVQDSDRPGMADADRALGPNLRRRELRGMGGYQRKSQAYSATMTGTLGNLELVSATGYGVDDRRSSLESLPLGATANTFFPGSGRASIITRMENKKLTQELRGKIPIGERLNWLFGVFYTEEEDEYRVDALANTSSGGVAGLLIRNLGLPGTSFEEHAAFTNLTVDITDRFDIQFGGRFSENKQVFARASVLLGANPVSAAPNFFQTSRSEDDSFTYVVAPRFKVSPDLMMYARVASGYRPGGPNFNCGLLPANLCEFDADTSTNYEIGVKGSVWDRRFTFDTAAYYIDWKDLQVGPLVLAGNQYFTNASRARSQGVELSAQSRPLPGLNVMAWLAYNDAELAERMPTPLGTGATFIAKGTRLPFSSEWTGGLSVDQEFPLPLWSGAEGVIGVDGNYVGERPGTLSNTNMLRAKPSYVEVNLRVGLTHDTWRIQAFVNNLTDRRGILRGGDDGLGPTLFNYIEPRTIGVSLTKEFGR